MVRSHLRPINNDDDTRSQTGTSNMKEGQEVMKESARVKDRIKRIEVKSGIPGTSGRCRMTPSKKRKEGELELTPGSKRRKGTVDDKTKERTEKGLQQKDQITMMKTTWLNKITNKWDRDSSLGKNCNDNLTNKFTLSSYKKPASWGKLDKLQTDKRLIKGEEKVQSDQLENTLGNSETEGAKSGQRQRN